MAVLATRSSLIATLVKWQQLILEKATDCFKWFACRLKVV